MLRTSRICNIEFINSLFDHGLLLGLGDDDHIQYLLASGARALAGNWNLGGFNLTNGGVITGSSFITGSNIGIATDPDLIQLTGANAVRINGALTVSNNSVLGSDSAVFQPNADSTTFFQVLDADGGDPVLNVDTINERVGIGTNAPNTELTIAGSEAILAGTPSFPVVVASGSGTTPGFIFEYTPVVTPKRFISFWTGADEAVLGIEEGLTAFNIGTYSYADRYSTGVPDSVLKLNVATGNPVATITGRTSSGDEIALRLKIGHSWGIGDYVGLDWFASTKPTGRIAVEADASGDFNMDFYTTTDGGTNIDFVMRLTDDGLVGIGTKSPTTKFSVNEKSGMTPIGGFAVKLTNKTGSNSVAGELVNAHTSVENAVEQTAINDAICIGVFLDSGITDGSEAWVVVGGIAGVLVDGSTTVAVGDWVKVSSNDAGRCEGSGSETPGANHFREIGHALEAGGNNELIKISMHFN